MPGICPRCTKSVYAAEEIIALSRSWHKLCFKCSADDCNKLLQPGSVQEHDEKLFCKTCYGKNFGPSGYGYGVGAGCLSSDLDKLSIQKNGVAHNNNNNNNGLNGSSNNGEVTARRVNRSVDMSRLGGSPLCPRCGKAVYFAEERIALGKKFHKSCFKCSACNKLMDSTNCTEHDEQLFCKTCYGRKFGPAGYGFGMGAGVLSTDKENDSTAVSDFKRASITSIPGGRPKPSTNFSGAPRCPTCDEPVYFAEEKIALNKKWHKACFKCTNCKKTLDSTNVTEHQDKPYCKSCYSKSYGPVGYGFGVGAGVLSTDPANSGVGESGDVGAKAYVAGPKSAGPGKSFGFGGGDKCVRCQKTVYAAEKCSASDKIFHKTCFNCNNCHKKLEVGGHCDHENEVYCKTCYGRSYGPKGVGYGVGAGALSTE